ncbi:MAG: class I SAM-dependent methyltransferase [Candidatus Margulisbacteria bacterium]|nr:class I SAM-dependent methyltransferase [Candidatus Margulisiibacteriota bacterium]
MRILGTTGRMNQLLRIEKAVQRAERKVAPKGLARNFSKGDWLCFSTAARRKAEYAATPAKLFLKTIEDLDLQPENHFGDLGSGLGLTCFAAAMHFARVTGFELDQRLLTEAETIRQAFEIENVAFRHEDFLYTDLAPFQVLFLFQPFSQDFPDLMRDKLAGTTPGTVIISHIFRFTEPIIFGPDDFRVINPGWEPHSTDPYLIDFYAHERK